MTNVAIAPTHTQMLGWTLVEVKQIGQVVFPWTIEISQNWSPLFCCPVKGHIRVRYRMDTLFADVLHAWVDVQIMETENITNRPFHISAACCNLNNFLIISDIYGEIVRPGQAFACQIQKFTEYLSGDLPYPNPNPQATFYSSRHIKSFSLLEK